MMSVRMVLKGRVPFFLVCLCVFLGVMGCRDDDDEVVIEEPVVEEARGVLNVRVLGLPEGVDGWVEVRGPETTRVVRGTGALPELAAGTYTLWVREVTEGVARYRAEQAEVVVELRPGAQEEVNVGYEVVRGRVDLRIGGLPDELGARVDLSGGDRSGGDRAVRVERSTIVDELVPGTYTAVAENVSDGPATYSAEPLTFVVVSGQTTRADVDYKILAGSLRLRVEGLAPGLLASLFLRGEAGELRRPNEDGVFPMLEPGNYELEVGDVSASGVIWEPERVLQEIAIRSGVRVEHLVTYEVVSGSLALNISGLPEGIGANVVLLGPEREASVTETLVIDEAIPGIYRATARDVVDGLSRWSVGEQNAELVFVGSAESVEISVDYELVPGTLLVEIGGLPSGMMADVEVVLPGGDTLELSETTLLEGVEPGPYVLRGRSVNDGFDNVYAFTSPMTVLDVASGEAASIVLSYDDPTLVSGEDDDGPGSLREVLRGVQAGTTVRFADGVEEIALESEIEIEKSLRIDGGAGVRIISGGTHRIFSMSGAMSDVELWGLTFQGGGGVEEGGAVRAVNRRTVIDGCKFFGNESSAYGGAVMAQGGEGLVIRRSVFAGNEARWGGAVAGRFVGDLRVEGSTFEGNDADDLGGALFAKGEAANGLSIRGSLFAENSSGGLGGALVLEGPGTHVVNSTFVGNRAEFLGGGLSILVGEVTLGHLTLTRNTAGEEGGAIHGGSGTVSMGSSIIAGNEAPQGPDWFTSMGSAGWASRGFNITGVALEGTGSFENDLSGTLDNPLVVLLEELADNGGPTQTMALMTMSPGTGLIPAEQCVGTLDQRGLPRGLLGRCSAGAFERQPDVIETFDGSTASGTYTSGTFTGVGGITWEFEDCRDEGAYGIDGAGLILREGSSLQGEVSGGLGVLVIQARRAFSSTVGRQLEVVVNDGEQVYALPMFGDGGEAEDRVHTFATPMSAISGDVKIEVRNVGEGRVTIDNLAWTGFGI